ncbi:Ser/Thr protein kinase RdoA (MazF antagonist) [Paenibacillus rhizosphaerae]|uniref:Ser/Thr protein kinase RdoA (MazF antagonist) n=1 Tax=Paenibacillus rhizosphaerae TaxID=297318 RepID=A0A839TJP7_9BACL|nr:phosphotransferase [Paenibacillus rhizosphaerae]MBB3127016.1 Ser/Thr protein kinase RdoA (MazF antagonist) [Paenibacillus rhizosphaerae]
MYTQPTTLRSVLDPKYLKYSLSKHYDIGEWDECLYWLRGLNDTYRIRTSSGFYILRIYRVSIEENDVAYELSLLTQLKGELNSVSTKVSEPIYKKDNSLYTVVSAPEGQRIAVIFRYLTGTENVLHDEKSCFSFGKSAAELHTAMDRITLNQSRYALDTNFLISQPLNRIVKYIGEKHSATSFLREYGNALIERINTVTSHGLDWGICHGDMHGNNNAFQEGDSFTHYDFEWSAKGWRAYDLAQVRGRKRQLEDKKAPLWNALISGYRSIRDFSDQDESAIELFMKARQLWVMGLEVTFIPNDFGVLDYSEEWIEGFINEFRSHNIV